MNKELKVTIDLSNWEDPYALSAGEAVLKSVIKSLRLLQNEHVCPLRQDGTTNPIEWLEDVLYLVKQVNKKLKRIK